MLSTLFAILYPGLRLALAAPAYAAAAYCPENNNSPGTQLSCHVGNCPRVDAADTTTGLEFKNTPGTDTTGFVAIDRTDRLIVVGFRGTASLLGWIIDFRFNRVPTTICDGCNAHQGCWDSWLSVEDVIFNTVKNAVAANPRFSVVCTGHSLGGAIASLAAANLRNAGYNATLYSFGAARFADAALSDYISNQPASNYQYYMTTPNFFPVNPADIRVCSGSLDRGCSAGWVWFDVISHV
ncbi:hypothetical protein AG0111_0g12963 [Alternaria gaisen]|uniref:Uncharacterized protein n=1 Tax=Alternaria gaisen TaxID=167740 RepID=A0ACB6F301_9PLEO|nr:hypothetical protein AG0111_0g12963 [Alternaria gaisen]